MQFRYNQGIRAKRITDHTGRPRALQWEDRFYCLHLVVLYEVYKVTVYLVVFYYYYYYVKNTIILIAMPYIC